MPTLQNSDNANLVLNDAVTSCKKHRHEFVTPEHILEALLRQEAFAEAVRYINPEGLEQLEKDIKAFLAGMESVPDSVKYEITPSAQTDELMNFAYNQVLSSSAPCLDVPHLVNAILNLSESNARFMLEKAVEGETEELMTEVIGQYEDANAALAEDGEGETRHEEAWRAQVVCLNDTVADHNPLIGREAELERTIQVLCRKEKNNPLHVGEAGVGKTALVYGLAARIVAGDVPERLSGSRIYQLDLGTLLAGTQFRGDFEKRIKSIMDGVRREGKAIVYIDEIHNLVGAGRTGDGSMDASNMLKPYLEAGDIRFIGSTTYEEFNRYLSRSKGIVRRFQQIDIDEPSVDETVKIIGGLKKKYEE